MTHKRFSTLKSALREMAPVLAAYLILEIALMQLFDRLGAGEFLSHLVTHAISTAIVLVFLLSLVIRFNRSLSSRERELKQSQAALQKSETLLDATSRIAKVGGWHLALETKTLTWTAETRRIHEVDEGFEPQVETAINFYTPESRDTIARAVERCLHLGESYDLEVEIITATGRKLSIRTLGAPVYHDGKIVSIEGTFQDISEQKRLMEMARRQDKLEALTVFGGGLAHDLNNLMARILGNVTLAREGMANPVRAATHLDRALAVVPRIEKLTAQLLLFARQESEERVARNLNGIIQDHMELIASGSNVKLHFNLAENLHPCEIVDGQFTQLLANLTINAIQAMPDGGNLTTRTGNIEIAPHHASHIDPGRYIQIAITDTGSGIPLEIQKKIFTPFFTTKKEGSGLGLAICNAAVVQMGGHLDLQSEPGRGTTFVITLPATEKVPEQLETKRIPVLPKMESGGKTILVMDDEEDIREIVSESLGAMGFDTVCAASGKEALEIFSKRHAEGKKFSACIFDLTLPGGIGGREVATEILKVHPETKVVLCSGYIDESAKEEFLALGIAATLHKPFSLYQLRALFASLFGA